MCASWVLPSVTSLTERSVCIRGKVGLPWLEHIHFMVTPTWHVDLVKNHYRELESKWPKIARLCLQLSGASLVGLRSIGLWQAAGELSP